MNLINRLSIKNKTYLLVLLSVVVALILSFVSNNGLNTIRGKLNNLIFATKIERFTNKLILEEQKYRLNANASIADFTAANKSYEESMLYVTKIYQAIDSAGKSKKINIPLKDLEKTKHATDLYKNYYIEGVSLLTGLKNNAEILEQEGEFITRQIQEYVEAKRIELKKQIKQLTIDKINNGSNIWQYTYVTRLHEKKYRLSPDDKVFDLFEKDFKYMMSEWARLKRMSTQQSEFDRLKKFHTSAIKYQAAMLQWVELNYQLLATVLPNMKKLGNSIIKSTIKSAEDSVVQMSEKHNTVTFTLLLVTIITIIIGVLFGAGIASSISSVVSSFQSGLLNFFKYLNKENKTAHPIVIEGNSEISVMAEVVNQNIKKIQSVFDRKAIYQQALLEWAKVDYQDENVTIQKATELSAKALHVERVSIWFFNEDRSLLRCSDLYLGTQHKHETGMVLKVSDYPEYFKAIQNNKVIMATRARQDPLTAEFNESYFEPLNIYSLMDLPISHNNEVVGIICHEKVGEEKAWTTDEYDFASSVVNAISLSLEIKKRRLIQDELKDQKEMLHHHAHHDTLTNLPNRFLFNDRLNQAIKQARRSQSKIAVLFIDLDHFKGINDSMGHKIGDELLVEVAKRLKSKIRQTDTLARLGGDEFTIVLDQINNEDDIVSITQSLLKVMAAPFNLSSQHLYVTLSVGAAIYPDDGETAEELLRNADAAMYHAKDDGRNTYQFYTESMTEKAFERIAMEASFRNALENNEFSVYFQPQVDAQTEQLIGMEALVRWQHPDMGLISPSKFLSFAVETGLIIPLDLWVMRTAMSQLTQWRNDNLQPGILALNLSILQLESDSFIETMQNLIKETGNQANNIELEVTEGQIMKDPKKSIQMLHQLKEMGLSLAIDDFGTGYSSLSQLKRLPINKLKIDQSFIRDLPTGEEDVVLSKSVISLSRNMGLDVIAEGVETRQQKDFLLENGCRYIQGYYYGKPVPANEMEQRLKAKKFII